ncbi:hypothetical protein LOY44_18055 [Pseudomonas sp. B21-044]|uniref:hypothetical protein n=1 Tax=Pseudomonas sp. B21-044 TaxID=2895488 RepID=UPI00215F39AE|nr:hypothetical protein [Pseudomonas sp. B21-044]UVL17897.1 hypothetical protein LOY44_18055 [Pseudomonas sp. B21-044]
MKLLFAMAVAMMISVSGCDSASAADELGTLTLKSQNGQKTCSFPIVRGYHYYYMGNYGCTNDEFYTFELTGVKAGVEIRFCGGDNCDRSSGGEDDGNGGDCVGYQDGCFRYKIKTLKRYSSLDSFMFSEFRGTLVGYVPHSSFKMLEVHNSEHINGKLSRVEIKYCNESDFCGKNPGKGPE